MRNPFACVKDPNAFVTCPGNRFSVTYTPIVSKDGTIKLKPSGKVDIQAKIESFRDTTDMSFILARLGQGDTSVLRPDPGYYGDFTQMPKTMAEALQLVIDGRSKFDQLPDSIRGKFDYDFNKWFSSSGSSAWFTAMGFTPTSAVAPDKAVTQNDNSVPDSGSGPEMGT